MIPDRLVLGARSVAEALSLLITIGFWISLYDPFSAWAIIVALVLWFPLAAILFH